MRPQEGLMTQQTYMPPLGTPRDSTAAKPHHSPDLKTLRANCVARYAVGTPEHAALVDAVKREFPEIFDPSAACGSSDCA
jgi:hypothetical protein